MMISIGGTRSQASKTLGGRTAGLHLGFPMGILDLTWDGVS